MGAQTFPSTGRDCAKTAVLKITICSKTTIQKKLKKLGMKDRYICNILAQKRILKIQYTIYGDFWKKVRNLSHKYSRFFYLLIISYSTLLFHIPLIFLPLFSIPIIHLIISSIHISCCLIFPSLPH
jgi:hypothetical protein